MNHRIGMLLLLILSGSLFTACNQEQSEEINGLNQTVDSLAQAIDSLEQIISSQAMELELANQQLDELAGLVPESDGTPNNGIDLREGKHSFTLQWISWDEPGEVTIESDGRGWYEISGKQESSENDDYITIEGKIRPISERELEFDGTIESYVSHLNGGEVCVRSGKQTFKATGKRKYWRLQNMINCEGGRVTDYVDIYF